MRIFLISMVVLMIAACSSDPIPTPTSAPTTTPTPTLVLLPTETATESITTYITATYAPPTPTPPDHTPEGELSPVIRTDLIAPIHITLPQGWEEAHAALQMPEGGTAIGILPFSIYRGAVTGGTGYIVVVWAFRNITTANPFEQAGATIYLVGDGVRLLNLAVLDPGCNIGLELDREFMIGDVRAAGGYFAAEECPPLPDGTPGLPDAKGWFAVTQHDNINFAFYAYTEPPTAIDGAALTELQAILDSVVIDLSLLPEPEPTDE